MTDPPNNADRVLVLAESIFDNTAAEKELAELDEVLLSDAGSRKRYTDYCRLQVALRIELRAQHAAGNVHRRIGIETAAAPLADFDGSGDGAPFSAPLIHPTRGYFKKASSGIIGYFSQELPLSLLIASAIMGMAILLAGHIEVTHRQIAERSSPSPSGVEPTLVYVGRITGIAGVKWSEDPNYIPPISVGVALGRKYKLKSGLLKITYDSGANVILEGPCSYEVDSTAGGYLALGKLTARIGERGEGRGERGGKAEGGKMKDEGGRPNAASLATSYQPLATNPSPLSPPPSPLFTVRTPTAIVTDIGTEFGVEVAENEDTTSHVFEGKVLLQALMLGSGDRGIEELGDGGTENLKSQITLVAGDSALVEKDFQTGAARITFGRQTGAVPKFVRRLREPPKFIDLLDIVAGGNGTGTRRERGIDPETGMQDTVFLPIYRQTDGKYHHAKYFPLIDGVFMPDPDFGPVQLNSAGHTYDFPKALEPGTFASIWARAAEVPADKQNKWETPKEIGQYWIYAAPFGPEFMPERRGLLALCSGSGITFDLAAIQKAHAGRPLIRFRATAGKASPSLAEMLVFIDGRLVWKSGVISDRSSVKRVDVPIRSADRFLTLVAIEADDGRGSDWTVFGDPVLECLDSDLETVERRVIQ